MKRYFTLIFSAVCLASWTGANDAAALSLGQSSIKELWEKYDLVALVEIESGELVKIKDLHCGAKYSARVKEIFKGSFKAQEISFGPYLGLAIGEDYLVFLLSNQQQEPDKSRCRKLMPTYRVGFEGMSLFPVKRLNNKGYIEAANIPTEWFVIPNGLKTLPYSELDTKIDGKNVWVPMKDLSEYLKNLSIQKTP